MIDTGMNFVQNDGYIGGAALRSCGLAATTNEEKDEKRDHGYGIGA